MFGTFFVPALRTLMIMSDVVASRCWSGKLALRTSTGKFPEGSFASWRVPPPQPATAIAASPSAANARASADRCAPILPKVGGKYHGPEAPRRTAMRACDGSLLAPVGLMA